MSTSTFSFDGDYTRIDSPLTTSIRQNLGLLEALRDDIESADRQFSEIIDETKLAIENAETSDILYVIEGARSEISSPMEYGGHFLEVDRDLLNIAATQGLIRTVCIVGGDDIFLDFVSDLPAELFIWDSKSSGFDVPYMRELRTGPLCTNAEGADVHLIGEYLTVTPGDLA